MKAYISALTERKECFLEHLRTLLKRAHCNNVKLTDVFVLYSVNVLLCFWSTLILMC